MKALIAGFFLLVCSLAGAQTYPRFFSKISRTQGGLTAPINNSAQFGIELSSIGDLNDDGVVDLAVGATNQGGLLVGSAYVLFMNTNGTVNHYTKIDNTEPAFEQDSFGSSICGLGDLDGDGIEDIGVGAGYDSDGGFQAGAFWILFMKKDGTVKSRQKISKLQGNFTAPIAAGNVFGTGAAAIGDLDHDGVVDIAVGARIPGAVYILFLNTNGTVKSYKQITNGTAGLSIDTGGRFGYGLAGLGDVDGDGVPDIAVGAHRSNVTGSDSGVVFVIFLTSSGNVKGFKQIASGLANFNDGALLFGVGVGGIGDYNHDGVRDMVVGGVDDLQNTGAIWYLMLNSDGSVKPHYKIGSTTGNSDVSLRPGDFFGGSISSLGDLNSDGIPDIAVAAFQDDDGGSDSGAVWISVCSANNACAKIDCTKNTKIVAADTTFACGSLVNLTASLPAGSNGLWSVTKGNANITTRTSATTNIYLLDNKPVTVSWEVTVTGCTTTADYTTIVPFDLQQKDIPNVITPNNDGKNDRWKINADQIPINVRVYNRWGNLVFNATHYKNDWAGGSLDGGVYYYYIQAGNCNSDIKGTLSILR